MNRCDPAIVTRNKEVDTIRQRLMYFLQGKWCVVVEKQTSDEQRTLADEEMKDWFAAAEQVRAPSDALSLCLMTLVRAMTA